MPKAELEEPSNPPLSKAGLKVAASAKEEGVAQSRSVSKRSFERWLESAAVPRQF